MLDRIPDVKIKVEPTPCTTTLKHFENGNCNALLESGRLVKLPAEEVTVLKQLQIHSRAIAYYRNSEFLCSGDGAQHKSWEKFKGDPRLCQPFVSVPEFVEILEAFGCRGVAILRSFSGVHLLPGSEIFRRWRRDHYPGLGTHAPREKFPAGGQRLDRANG